MSVSRIGLISDTHGFLHPEVFTVFDGVDRILHAGDVNEPSILWDLETVAPVTAVWGNVDGPAVRAAAREEAQVEVGGLVVGLIHGHQVHPDYERLLERFSGARVIVHGHTHVPRRETVRDVWLVNPGAAGRAQKGYRASVALLEVSDGVPRVSHVDLPAS